MTNGLQLNTSTPVTGLGTSSFTVVTPGEYTCAFELTIPYNPAGSSYNSAQTPPNASGLQVVVNLNGSPVLTMGGSAANPTPSQPSMGGSVTINTALNDVITVVLSSSAAVDAQPNAVKGIINLFQGPA